MIPTNDISMFVKKNDSELRSLVIFICHNLGYSGSYEDIIQDIYLKLLTTNLLKNFDFNRTKISSYLWIVIRNFVITNLKNPEYKLISHRLNGCETTAESINNTDFIIHNHPIAEDFKNILLNNNSSDSFDGLGEKIRGFIQYFANSKKNKNFSLNKRKNKSSEVVGCNLLEIFNYLYKGYNNNEIAEIYGVTPMFVTNMKQQIAQAMMQYGF